MGICCSTGACIFHGVFLQLGISVRHGISSQLGILMNDEKRLFTVPLPFS